MDFQVDKGLSVTFISEPAVDVVGPLRKFFRLTLAAISHDSRIFEGDENKRIVTHNLNALKQRHYFLPGKLISLSIVYGGPGAQFLSETTAAYMFNEAISTASYTEIPDCEIRRKVEKVCFHML